MSRVPPVTAATFPLAEQRALPLISLVMPTMNSEKFIERSLDSIFQQQYSRLEVIIIDGGSSDGTLGIVEKYRDRITQVISEADDGQANAINKGFELARGEVFCWLNADDLLAAGALLKVGAFFAENRHAEFMFGDAIGIDESGRSFGRRMNVHDGGLWELVNESDFVVQPASFWRSDLWNETGGLREELHFTLDYEFYMRVAATTDLHYVPSVLALERHHRAAKTSNGGLARAEELLQVARLHGATQIARTFQPEASAVFASEAIRALRRHDLPAAQNLFRRSASVFRSPALFSAHLVVLLGRPGGLAKARLWSNRLRWVRSRSVGRPPKPLSNRYQRPKSSRTSHTEIDAEIV
ncbi:MAG: glycosyltransferase family 2 protein [Acidimicrobiales bacterium]